MAGKKKRGPGQGNIRQRANGLYEARVTVGVKPDGSPKRQSFYGKTEKEVFTKMTAALSEMHKGTYVEPTELTVGQWLDSFMETYKKPSVKPTTYQLYRTQAAHIRRVLGAYKLKDLRAINVQQFIVVLQAQKLANSTIRSIVQLLWASLEKAVENDIIVKNVAHRVSLPAKEKKEIQVLSPEEQATFTEAAKSYRMGSLFILDLCTGLRVGELLALHWEDIDFDKKLLRVKGTWISLKNDTTGKWYNTIGTPKTKSSYRDVPLQPVAIKLLHDIKKQQSEEMLRAGAAYERNDLVFCSKLGKIADERDVRDVFIKVCKKANIKTGVDGLHVHCLRHTFATRGLENGISMRVMQDLLGHATFKETADTYSHVLPDTREEEMKKLEGVVNY